MCRPNATNRTTMQTNVYLAFGIESGLLENNAVIREIDTLVFGKNSVSHRAIFGLV